MITVIIAEMIITLIYLNGALPLNSREASQELEMGEEELSEVIPHVILRRAPGDSGSRLGNTRSSCVSDLSSALQALEVRFLQDAVDLQVGHQVRGVA